MSKYSGFFAAYNASVRAGNTSTKEEVILDFTNNRTTSLRDMNDSEIEDLTRRLNELSNFKPRAPVANDKGDKMRKSIIAIFKSMGKSTSDAIGWAEKQGVHGNKKQFNDYTNSELFILIRVAEKIRSDYQKTIRQNLKKL